MAPEISPAPIRGGQLEPIFLDYLREFVHLSGHRPQTARRYGSVFRRFRRSVPQPLADIGPAQLATFCEASSDLGPRTLDLYLDILSAFFSWSVKRGHVGTNPFSDFRRSRAELSLPRPFELSEARGYVERCKNPREHMFLQLLLHTGGRPSEVANLNLADVDVSEASVTFTNTKGRRARSVFLGGEILTELRAYLDWRAKAAPPSEALFVQANGHRFGTREMRNACRRDGLPTTLHRYRHTFATQSLKLSGGDLRLVQELCGHASPLTTARYTQVDAAQKRLAAERLAGALGRTD